MSIVDNYIVLTGRRTAEKLEWVIIVGYALCVTGIVHGIVMNEQWAFWNSAGNKYWKSITWETYRHYVRC